LIFVKPNSIDYVDDCSSDDKLALGAPTSITKVPKIISRRNCEMKVD
jgi:hypothetical protein